MTPDALARLHAASFTTPRPWSAAEFASLLSSPGVFLTGTEAGFAMGRAVLDEAELLTIVIDPARRGQGLGRALLAAFHADAAAQGACRAFLEVSAENAPAIGLYRSAGWQEDGRRPRYYATPEGRRIDALLFSRGLETRGN
ncbi:MAG: ribosomal protein S18-alanine N-acetyltransferase [Paracoccaceae bacterium]|nr:ribosomal protein S18-alanine N-acetyltransferase [Paracoccaceae bacterium]